MVVQSGVGVTFRRGAQIAIIALAATSLAGCDAAPVKQCESFAKAKLRSPSTYKRISIISYRFPSKEPKEYRVSIEYDAANAYGTPIRSYQNCTYPLKNNQPDTSQFIDFDAVSLGGSAEVPGNAMQEADAALDAANAALNDAAESINP